LFWFIWGWFDFFVWGWLVVWLGLVLFGGGLDCVIFLFGVGLFVVGIGCSFFLGWLGFDLAWVDLVLALFFLVWFFWLG